MLNWARIEELRGEVGEDAFSEVVELFLEEVNETIGALGGSSAEIEQQLHFLKGAALNLGFEDFSHICQKGEADARDGHGDQVDLQAVRDCYAVTRDAFMDKINAAGFMAA